MAESERAASGPDALLVACSDYRWRHAFETFCQRELHLNSWDSVLVPGGIYLLSYPGALPMNYRVGSRMLEFLISQHRPRRVVLISHEGCARYRAGIELPPGRTLAAQQRSDLSKVTGWVTDRFPNVEVGAYHASGSPGEPKFEAVVPPPERGTVQAPPSS